MQETTILILALCLLLSTLFSALHISLTELSRAALEALAERRGTRPGKKASIAAINHDVAGHARAVALVRILFNLAMVVSAVKLIAVLRGGGELDWLDGVVAVFASAILVWVFNVIVAESLARHLSEKLVYAFNKLVRAVYLLQVPIAPLSRAIDTLIRGVTGARVIDKGQRIEQDLLDAVEEGEREGQIDEVERAMIEAVVNFKSRTVEQIMTPRNEIEALHLVCNLGEITAFVRKARHSRIPVYKESLDDIVGFFYVKDLLRWLAGEKPRAVSAVGTPAPAGPGGIASSGFDLRAILRPAMMVPETKTIRALAEEFVEKKVHVAVVADEYGGTAGIVSLEDIIEEVFGDIQDEYEKPEDDPPRIDVRIADGVADIDARAYIGDVNAALEPLGVEVPEGDEYDTLGGFVLSTLGRMPAQNESFTHVLGAGGLGAAHGTTPATRMVVTVLEATPTRVVKVRILVKREDADNGAGGASVSEKLDAERVGSK